MRNNLLKVKYETWSFEIDLKTGNISNCLQVDVHKNDFFLVLKPKSYSSRFFDGLHLRTGKIITLEKDELE